MFQTPIYCISIYTAQILKNTFTQFKNLILKCIKFAIFPAERNWFRTMIFGLIELIGGIAIYVVTTLTYHVFSCGMQLTFLHIDI